MIGWHIAAMRSRKSWAYSEVEPGRGLMNVIRELGCWWRALRRVIPIGMVIQKIQSKWVLRDHGQAQKLPQNP